MGRRLAGRLAKTVLCFPNPCGALEVTYLKILEFQKQPEKMADRPMEPLIDFGTQTCLEPLTVFSLVFVSPCCFFLLYVFVVALAKQMVV